jgi:hypothetical protein
MWSNDILGIHLLDADKVQGNEKRMPVCLWRHCGQEVQRGGIGAVGTLDIPPNGRILLAGHGTARSSYGTPKLTGKVILSSVA